MLKRIVSWLDEYIAEEEPASILKAMVGLLSFAGLLGTVFGSQAIRAAGFVIVVVLTVSTMMYLFADRRGRMRKEDDLREIAERACNLVIDRDKKPLVSIESWNETYYIKPNGDVEQTLIVRATAVRREVHFIRLTAGSGWDQPDKYLKKVKMVARSVDDNGTGGPHWITTRSWMSARKMQYFIHLYEPLHNGDKINFKVTWLWPAKCQPLMRLNAAETFIFRSTDLLCAENVTVKVVLPEGSRAVHQPVGFKQPHANNSIEKDFDEERRQRFTWRASDVPPYETMGIRLQLER